MKHLIKTDKNGTKYYACRDACPKCGGHGYIKCYHYNQGGICFDCGGSGIIEWNEKEYTPEYEAKLAERRAKAQAKKEEKRRAQAGELNKKFFERNGFNEDGYTWVVLGNTYSIKDNLKAIGAKWNNVIKKWHLDHDPEEYDTVKISVSDLYEADNTGVYSWSMWKAFNEDGTHDALIKIEEAEKGLNQNNSEYIGRVGDKVETTVTVKRITGYDTQFGYTIIYIMEDASGNVITWKTGTGFKEIVNEGETVTIKATIKSLEEYNGTKQTNVIRCKAI